MPKCMLTEHANPQRLNRDTKQLQQQQLQPSCKKWQSCKLQYLENWAMRIVCHLNKTPLNLNKENKSDPDNLQIWLFGHERLFVWANSKRQSIHSRVFEPFPHTVISQPLPPKPLFVLNRPWQRSERDTIVAECVRMSLSWDVCWAQTVCVSVAQESGLVLETGSRQSPGVDVRRGRWRWD